MIVAHITCTSKYALAARNRRPAPHKHRYTGRPCSNSRRRKSKAAGFGAYSVCVYATVFPLWSQIVGG